jgi:hypothetical protein
MPEEFWPSNYFNYFTEVEEQFQKARGTSLFLLSPLDWALIESWKGAGIPLTAVLRGIDVAFEKWRGKKVRTQKVNSLAFCAQAVMTEAQAMVQLPGAAPSTGKRSEAPFALDELTAYLVNNQTALKDLTGYDDIIAGLDRLIAEADTLYHDLEQMEQRLTALEEKMVAIARTRQSEDDLFQARRELDQQLRPYRGKMSAEQIALLERQYVERRLLESAGLPRLSLFYLS